MIEILTERQRAVAERFLEGESARRRHLVVSLSGAHAYGFPSPDSDLDLKAIHIEPTGDLLSLTWQHAPVERLEIIDGVEIDYSSNELRDVLFGVLQGNGNYIERLVGHLQFQSSQELEALGPLVRASISKRLYRHYRNRHLDAYGFPEARELVAQKLRGELAELPEPLIEGWRKRIHRAFELLESALQTSPLPEEAPNVRELNAWLLAVRFDGAEADPVR
jgi:hypothetical protein